MACTAIAPTCVRCGAVGHLAVACERPFFRAHCAFCRKTGHAVEECYARARARREEARAAKMLGRERQNELRAAERETLLVARACFVCGQVGHLQAECPQLRSFPQTNPHAKKITTRANVSKLAEERNSDTQSVSTAATSSEFVAKAAQRQPRKGARFDAALATAAAVANAAETKVASRATTVSSLRFGLRAFAPLRTHEQASVSSLSSSTLQAQIKDMVIASVKGAASMRGQRGERLVTDMLTTCYANGLFMHGAPSSPLNRLIIPAMQYIFAEMAKVAPLSSKRVDCLTTLVHACQDCQQVQAREILRIYGDLTAQNETFEGQLQYSLLRIKEAALNRYISRQHPRCDLDHTQIQPWQQRAHLWSGYIVLVGGEFGLDGITAAKSDRFLAQAQGEIGGVKADVVMEELRRQISASEWVQTLLADINNQAEAADRLIDRECIFKWVQTNMSTERAHLVFYDEERAEEFAEQEPRRPTKNNWFQPFLSRRVLVEILTAASMLAGAR